MSIPPAGDDRDDWSQAQRGIGEGFGRIFDRHRDRVYRHVLRLVPLPADADDAVAIVFFEAWRRRDDARLVDGSLLPWLLVTATKVTQNLNRSARRHRALLAKLPPEDHALDHAEHLEDGPASAALRDLPLSDRHIITLCVLEGLTDREAAIVLDLPVGTVKSRLSRAKRRLADRIDPHSAPMTRLDEAAHDA
ncbi:RNA polymerase sigma factor [Microcella humidisoli]|uniref:RNA polymerase sigma factor n=1 Tax=Microcella humidisoli TaxID=2963406 RepID=A0ABY5FVF9_9MICO|nr:RNA polymerase sigma factor [Microcella humidisoli]UTT62264.1 RNA polymerase sigma factor [Microcella humidisoli]